VEIEQIRKVERNSVEEVRNLNDKKKKDKKCKHFNLGHCKYKMKCRFTHPKEVCKEYSEGKCSDTINCPHHHPNLVKVLKVVVDVGEEKHVISLMTLLSVEIKEMKQRCSNVLDVAMTGKKDGVLWSTKLRTCSFISDDWITDKSKVLDQGWSLFDQDSNLNHLV
jgi:hypothetical protein